LRENFCFDEPKDKCDGYRITANLNHPDFLPGGPCCPNPSDHFGLRYAGGKIVQDVLTVPTTLCHLYSNPPAVFRAPNTSEPTKFNWWLGGLTEDERKKFKELEKRLSEEALKGLEFAEEQWEFCESNSDTSEHVVNEDEWAGFNKAKELDPTHYFNSGSTAISLVCFIIWLFQSPRQTRPATSLDRTCKRLRLSYFFACCASNLLLSFCGSGQFFPCPIPGGTSRDAVLSIVQLRS
jgi:hypothetical protein